MNLGKNVKRLRKKLGLSQQKMATDCGIAISTLQKIENGQNLNPTMDVLRALAKALGVTMDELAS